MEGQAEAAAAVMLGATPEVLERWRAQAASQRQLQRRSMQFGLFAVGHNLLWTLAFLAWAGL